LFILRAFLAAAAFRFVADEYAPKLAQKKRPEATGPHRHGKEEKKNWDRQSQTSARLSIGRSDA
jgi:hypothetical protein